MWASPLIGKPSLISAQHVLQLHLSSLAGTSCLSEVCEPLSYLPEASFSSISFLNSVYCSRGIQKHPRYPEIN